MRLWLDRRIGGVSTWRLLPEGETLMQVPDEIRRCVCFIYSKEADGRVAPRGTAFFVSVARGHGIPGNWIYLVTARHVIAGIAARRADGEFLLRLNSHKDGVLWTATKVSDWAFHPDESLIDDTAFVAFAPPTDAVDYRVYPLESAVTEEIIRDRAIGVGDEVFLPGLFVNHTGTDRNIPIVRIGNIAAVPDEPVKTTLGPMPAYLVEARSIGGLSGSPVFVNVGQTRQTPDGGFVIGTGGPGFFLLGLMHGHYQVSAAGAKQDDLSEEAINMGIAIVLPVSRILESINGEEQMQSRDERDSEEAKKGLPTPDTAAGQTGDTEFGRFENLTRKLVNTPKPKPDESES